MFSSISAIIKLILRLFNLFKFVDYKNKTLKREKNVKILKDKNATKDSKLRALDELSK